VSLAAALERAAEALPGEADAIRPANGDPRRLLASLPAAAAPRVLAWLLAHEPEAAAELIDAWLALEGGAELVLAVDEGPLAKPARKLLRRARHQLKSQGVAVAEAQPAPTVAHLPRVEDELAAAAVTAPDPTGACVAYLVEPHPSGGVRLFEIAFAEGGGILSVEVYSAGRSKVRAFLREVTGRRGLPAVDAPPVTVRALLRQVAQAQPADKPLPAGWLEWQGRLGEVAAGTPTPGEFAREALGEPDEPLDLEAALALVQEGRIGPWPVREVLERTAQRMQEAVASPLIVAGGRRREQLDALMREGAEEAFGAAGGERVAALLRHAAFVFQGRGDEGAARACLAASVAFVRRPVGENPVAQRLFARPLESFAARLEQQESEQAEASSLIVRPGAPAGPIR
jgi:hypothetical protein